MSIQILDCTLRDGGYVNNWDFGENCISQIINNLSKSNIDIIECGFLSNIVYNKNLTLFNNINEIQNILPSKSINAKIVAMLTIGEDCYDITSLEDCSNKSITGVRVAFHKNQESIAINYSKILVNKGYDVFFQPMGTMQYTRQELLTLTRKINELNPYAFYIVDTLGEMNNFDTLNIFDIVDKNLSSNIKVGLHSHNNLQLSFSNSIALINANSSHELIIDSSVLGMGRGAGNLCTEMIAQYLNGVGLNKYDLTHIYDIIDNHILKIKQQFDWGYSAKYHISAINRCHPNYVKFLTDFYTFDCNKLNYILSNIDENKKYNFDQDYIKNFISNID